MKHQEKLRMDNVTNKTSIAAIICGYERGGTTLISEILRQYPNLYSGFECGLLLAEKMPEFLSLEPYNSMTKLSWRIKDDELEYVCQANTWLDAYKRLKEKTRLITKQEGALIFDKTPKYMQKLSQVLAKVPDVPCIVIVRDPRAVLWSWAKRSGLGVQKWVKEHLDSHCERYLSYANGWKEAVENGLGDQILLIQYESLCISPVDNARKIFEFIGLEFDNSYLHFQEESKKFDNVYNDTVSSSYINEYKDKFSQETCTKILDKTAEFQDWFFNIN